MDAQMQARRAMESDLRKALAQPASSSSTTSRSSIWRATRSCGFEALIRWHHPEKGMIPPERLHSAGRGDRPDRPDRRMGRSGRPAPRPRDGRTTSRSPSTSRRRNSATPGSCRWWSSALSASGLPPGRLELEITETALLADNAGHARHAASDAQTLGVRIANDDFGTGYSSLSHLQSFPFDRIKIDRSFVEEHRRVRRLAQHRAGGGGAGAAGSAYRRPRKAWRTRRSSTRSDPRAAPRCRAS